MNEGKRCGFTLIEMLIVILVIAILVMIVIPRLLEVGRKAKEAALRQDLLQLRAAIGKFEADCGDFPAKLGDLMNAPPLDSKGGNGVLLNVGGWKGPYLKMPNGELPKDPFTGAADWKYDPPSGDVHSTSTKTARDGTKYQNW